MTCTTAPQPTEAARSAELMSDWEIASNSWSGFMSSVHTDSHMPIKECVIYERGNPEVV